MTVLAPAFATWIRITKWSSAKHFVALRVIRVKVLFCCHWLNFQFQWLVSCYRCLLTMRYLTMMTRLTCPEKLTSNLLTSSLRRVTWKPKNKQMHGQTAAATCLILMLSFLDLSASGINCLVFLFFIVFFEELILHGSSWTTRCSLYCALFCCLLLTRLHSVFLILYFLFSRPCSLFFFILWNLKIFIHHTVNIETKMSTNNTEIYIHILLNC